MDDRADGCLWSQDGVISRGQALSVGLTANDLRRLLRRRELVPIQRGVYVDHTGATTWQQDAWAAVLALAPAALWGPSATALRGHPIHVATDRDRGWLQPLEGVIVHRVRDLDRRVDWLARPPRMRAEPAAIDAAAVAGSELDAIAELGRAIGERRTTAARLLQELDRRGRTRRGVWLRSVLTDLADGSCSALEHGYLTRVQRPHGLPGGVRQALGSGRVGRVLRDVKVETVIIELDGRLFHDNARARDRDFDRDLDAAADGDQTIRLTWGQVFSRPCETAARLARVFERHGIHVERRSCPQCAR